MRVNRQTFYYHFDDVYDLLEWVFEEDANAKPPRKRSCTIAGRPML